MLKSVSTAKNVYFYVLVVKKYCVCKMCISCKLIILPWQIGNAVSGLLAASAHWMAILFKLKKKKRRLEDWVPFSLVMIVM